MYMHAHTQERTDEQMNERTNGRADGRTYGRTHAPRFSFGMEKSTALFAHRRHHAHTPAHVTRRTYNTTPICLSLSLSFSPPSLSFTLTLSLDLSRLLLPICSPSSDQSFSRSLSNSLSCDRLHVQPVGLYMSNDARKPSPSLSLSIFFSL